MSISCLHEITFCRQYICHLLLAIMLIGTCPNILADDSTNLIPNPSFELVDDGNKPLYWSNYVPHFFEDTVSVSSDSVHSGSRAWKGVQQTIGGYPSGLTGAIPVEPGCPYLLSAWLKSQNGSERINFGWFEYNAADQCISFSYWLLNYKTAPTSWKQFADVRLPDPNTAYVKVIFFGPYESIGTVWVDDVELVKVDTQPPPPVGDANNASNETIDFGSSGEADSPVQYNADTMSQVAIDGDIDYRQLLPNKLLALEFPAFNVDANGFPLTPMLLEIRYKDTINDLSTSHQTSHRAIISSEICFMNPDPLFKGASDRIYYRIAGLEGSADNNWKYKQIAFRKSPFQLLRAIDGRFKLRIEMPQDSSCYLPIDYITLASITQSQCDQMDQKQRLLNGFTQVDLRPDQPVSPPTYSDLTIFTRDPMKPIYSFTKPFTSEITTDISSFTAKGEVEPLNFAIYSQSGIENLSFQLSDLTNAQSSSVIAASQLSLWHVVCDNKRLTPYTYKNRYANIPDRLEPASLMNVNTDTSERLWLKVAVPANAQAGIYRGHVNIFQNGTLRQTLNLSLNVLPFNLQAPENLNPVIRDPYGTIICSDSNEVYKLYNEAGFDPFIYGPWPQLRPIVSSGTITGFSCAGFETSLQKMVEKGFAKSTILIETEPTWKAIYQIIYNMNESQIACDPDLYYRLSNSTFVNAFSMALQKYLQIGSANGLKVIFSAIDEPGSDPFKRIAAERLFEIIHQNGAFTTVTYYDECDQTLAPGMFNISSNNGYGGEIPPLTRCVDFKLWTPLDQDAGFAKCPTNFGYYTTDSSYLRNPVYNRFSHGLLAFRTSAKIVAAYAMGHWIGDPFNDFDADASYIYPFTNPDFLFAYPTWNGKLLPTMGFEGIREGIKDAKYIATLKRLINEKPNTPVSIEAGNYLDAVKHRIDPNYLEAYLSKSDDSGFYKPIIADLSDSNNPDDFEAFTRIRQTIANYIIQLSSYPSVLPGDLNGDKKVDYFDLVIFTSHWLQIGCNNPEWCDFADFDHSGDVDFVDFAVFASNWLWLQ
jgi:hypothetical protein